METRVVGLYYRGDGARLAVDELEPGDEVTLEPEPENKYDAYAVKVLSGSVHIGYLPKELAAYLTPPLENGVYLRTEQERQNLYPIIDLVGVED